MQQITTQEYGQVWTRHANIYRVSQSLTLWAESQSFCHVTEPYTHNQYSYNHTSDIAVTYINLFLSEKAKNNKIGILQ